MDGSRITSEVYLREEEQTEWDFMETSERTRRFKFSPLKVTEGETTVDETVAGSKIMEKVGVIKVAVYAAIRNGYLDRESSENDGDETPSKKPPAIHSVPESLTKGKVMHQIDFGEEKVTKPQDPSSVASSSQVRGQRRRRPQRVPAYLIDKTKLLAKFTFHYRPLDALQRAGIAPRDPTPPPPGPEPVNEPVGDPVEKAVDGPVAGHIEQPVERRLPLAPADDTSEVQSPSNKRKAPSFGAQEEEKADFPDEYDNYHAEDKEREEFLLAELEKIRNKRSVKEGAFEGSPHKRFKQEDRPAFVQGEVINLT